ncbi:30S ribosome-binding factor RbfA [Stenoxybacter acetivorans]|uniref:30S ribosome-binding factor RbfA n=1 Tax=Stenoxybacter acetivorans TaxID=422441 RepID=UPI00056C2F5F|nr:30S ribosome-binding factor RbfA [Stenoxybacter acetivorans]
MRRQQRGYDRQDRVKEQIMRELADLTRHQLKDPRAGFITINDVDITRDYSYATVYYTVLDSNTRAATAEALEHAKGHLRSELSKRIRLFRAPQLQFTYDESLERGMNISQLIDEAMKETPVAD